MRTAFSQSLIRLAQADPNVVLLTGDHGYALFDEFRRVCAQQYVNAGIAEQNMVGVAAGLAKAGLRPIVYGLSAFVPIRVLEQIKIDVCYEQLPVIFAGDGAGVVYSALGSSHQSTEDVAALRALPSIQILSPADAYELKACMTLAYETAGPVYLRMGKADLGDVHDRPLTLRAGEVLNLRAGQGPLAFLATGSMVKTALKVADDFPGAAVWSVPSIKPLSEAAVASVARAHQVLVVVEEHSVLGGLGAAVAEIVSTHAPTYVCRIGIQDRFSEFCGSYSYLMQEHRLTADDVQAQVEAFLGRLTPVSS
ncbi:transketolase [Deinococcus metalli]|uniref:Transketolase n=1 Tax=Deinococcus metalli TaxID=1141878 RepID=A0A7W8KCW2_9DEIO|nr:transketolase C-terminal domain-containing protein [Deinococcus metalli]MBB5375776.1 transketolase [Deinococcus metalli]GHF37139.1 transketolase [Deinococcus metalli]